MLHWNLATLRLRTTDQPLSKDCDMLLYGYWPLPEPRCSIRGGHESTSRWQGKPAFLILTATGFMSGPRYASRRLG